MGKVLCAAADMAMSIMQMRLTTWSFKHIHADLAKNIGDNLNKFISKNQGELPRLQLLRLQINKLVKKVSYFIISPVILSLSQQKFPHPRARQVVGPVYRIY